MRRVPQGRVGLLQEIRYRPAGYDPRRQAQPGEREVRRQVRRDRGDLPDDRDIELCRGSEQRLEGRRGLEHDDVALSVDHLDASDATLPDGVSWRRGARDLLALDAVLVLL